MLFLAIGEECWLADGFPQPRVRIFSCLVLLFSHHLVLVRLSLFKEDKQREFSDFLFFFCLLGSTRGICRCNWRCFYDLMMKIPQLFSQGIKDLGCKKNKNTLQLLPRASEATLRHFMWLWSWVGLGEEKYLPVSYVYAPPLLSPILSDCHLCPPPSSPYSSWKSARGRGRGTSQLVTDTVELQRHHWTLGGGRPGGLGLMLKEEEGEERWKLDKLGVSDVNIQRI